MARKTGVEPIRFSQWEPLLQVRRSRIVGYRAWCSCQWVGPKRREYSFARADAHWHECGDPLDMLTEATENLRMPTEPGTVEDAQATREREA